MLQKTKGPLLDLSGPRLAAPERLPVARPALEDSAPRRIHRRMSDGSLQLQQQQQISAERNDVPPLALTKAISSERGELQLEFFKENLIKFKQEKQAEITSELFVPPQTEQVLVGAETEDIAAGTKTA